MDGHWKFQGGVGSDAKISAGKGGIHASVFSRGWQKVHNKRNNM